MKIIFVLDDNSVLVAVPEDLQLRQVQPDLAALTLPAGKNEEGEDLFRPLITYPVFLTAPAPQPVATVEATPVPVQKPELVKGKKPVRKPELVKGKKKS